jgi:chaperone modulatory protein CbpM
MRLEISEALWLDESGGYTLARLAELSGLPESELRQLMDYDALPVGRDGPSAEFGADCLIVARAAARLRQDFDLDAAGLALVLALLERIRGLEAELHGLQAQLPRRVR